MSLRDRHRAGPQVSHAADCLLTRIYSCKISDFPKHLSLILIRGQSLSLGDITANLQSGLNQIIIGWQNCHHDIYLVNL